VTRDYAFEALAEVTSTDWTAGRGELNSALKSIREQSEIEDPYLLADEIHVRAKMYRAAMPEVMLTASALAKHWLRVFEEAQRTPALASNQAAPFRMCDTCGGDKMVVVAKRKPVQSAWMRERGIEPNESQMIEEMAPCPDCNTSANTTTYRPNGEVVRGPDPAKTREMMGL
jgi:hypothetical protein